MGFGFTVVGYFFAFLMSNFHSVFAFVGAYLMMIGLWKLKDYKSKFKYAIYPLGVIMALALKDTALDILSIFGIEVGFFNGSIVLASLEFLNIASVALFHIALFLSVAELAQDVQIEKIRVASLRNMFFFVLYTVLCAVRFLPLNYGDTVLLYFNLIIQLMQILWIVLSILLLFSCFRKIADREELEKEIAKEQEEAKKKGE